MDFVRASDQPPRCGAFSGDDATVLGCLAKGGDGCIYTAFPNGDIAEAQITALALTPLANAQFVESNPVPVKHALNTLGWITERGAAAAL
nr:dihydrodipicolinate synthase family protein [Azospirillum brasilense]